MCFRKKRSLEVKSQKQKLKFGSQKNVINKFKASHILKLIAIYLAS